MKSVRSKLIAALGLVASLTVGMALLLYVGDSRFEDNARQTRQGNDDVRDLLDFALLAQHYMDVFGRSLGQRTLVANRERRLAAAAFEDRTSHIASRSQSSAFHTLHWHELRKISTDLSKALQAADQLRANGDFDQAERAFNEARRGNFDREMLPWFEQAIGVLRAEASRLELEAIGSATRLRNAGTVFGSLSILIAALAVAWISRSVLRPIQILVTGADAIGRGDWSHRLLPHAGDEFSRVIEHFNRMAETIATTQATLVEKNTQLHRAYLLQGEFVSAISHELRSPLHSVLGYLEFVREDEPTLSVRSQKHLTNIATSAKRLLALVNDILDFSKLEAKQMEAKVTVFELSLLMQAAFDDAQALIQGRAIELVLDAPPEKIALESDDTKLRQILTNLLSNALKFTDRGVVTLAARVNPDGVEIGVRDTGIGIPADQLDVIFQPFRQAKATGSRAFGGTGLGLAIVGRLAKLIGASVSVASTLGQGTEFKISIPRTARGK